MKSVLAGLGLLGLLASGDLKVQVAESDQCVQQCRSAHNQCRIATKGSPSCDSQLQACLDSCRSRR